VTRRQAANNGKGLADNGPRWPGAEPGRGRVSLACQRQVPLGKVLELGLGYGMGAAKLDKSVARSHAVPKRNMK
jgi:hypothetical protein